LRSATSPSARPKPDETPVIRNSFAIGNASHDRHL
jgi:hypothetical protein